MLLNEKRIEVEDKTQAAPSSGKGEKKVKKEAFFISFHVLLLPVLVVLKER
jgi:hypothetical protein